MSSDVSGKCECYDELLLENGRLREELEQLRRDLDEQRRAFRRPVGRKWSYRQLTALAESLIRRHVDEAGRGGSVVDAWLLHAGYAEGVREFWGDLTFGWQDSGDSERLCVLARRVDEGGSGSAKREGS